MTRLHLPRRGPGGRSGEGETGDAADDSVSQLVIIGDAQPDDVLGVVGVLAGSSGLVSGAATMSSTSRAGTGGGAKPSGAEALFSTPHGSAS
jgi:hypothetical protein